MAPKKPNKLATLREAFEKSDADDDKGMKEGSKKEEALDTKQFMAFKKKKGGK